MFPFSKRVPTHVRVVHDLIVSAENARDQSMWYAFQQLADGVPVETLRGQVEHTQRFIAAEKGLVHLALSADYRKYFTRARNLAKTEDLPREQAQQYYEVILGDLCIEALASELDEQTFNNLRVAVGFVNEQLGSPVPA